MKIRYLKMPILIVVSLFISILMLNIGFSNYHLKNLLDSVESTEEVMLNFNDRIRLNETADSNCYRSENVGRVYCGLELNNWAQEKAIFSARQSRIDLEVEVYKLNQVRVLFFGNEFKPTIEEYNRHVKAWIDLYERLEGCSDFQCFRSEYLKPSDISTTFKVAEIEFRSVIPMFDLFNSENRINLIFKD